MTTVILNKKTSGHYITLDFELRERGGVYIVGAFPHVNGDLYGHPDRQIIYGANELEKAKATFRRYCNRYA